MTRLTDGERDILRELERDARDLAPPPEYTEEEQAEFERVFAEEIRRADEAHAAWLKAAEETARDDGPPF